ncbi:YbhB/YbcL family Raf kinase inhibitor-like protein [Aspergillus neoniger CBS 115656]|uniref:PEBP-like protein n=1 Tax=Aspergillus neoniger (strain CBS 115656) TaxID=1448310 RepID=A0A318YBY4_ASPNB|nr:PEBP-like protein [Aspergillus neoniger CBS 115656]PYH31866.1 PEBP-like protein [Aspergillus neoniger CBS 115656]
MRYLSLLSALAATALAQTPPGSYPSTNKNFGVAFPNATVTPGTWVTPDDLTSQPAIYVTENLNKDATYMVVMLDLNIPDSDVTTAAYYDTLVPGLAVNTTTRLHWWGGNYTIQNGRFVNSSDAISEYTAPRPRDSTNHTYTLYLFDQPEGYVPFEEAANGTYYSQTAFARFNFTLEPILRAVGGPVAANYFLSDEI